jgi:hypothetical protein
MQKKILVGAVALAALGLGAGSAFTASNTMPAGSLSGYGQVVSTGATVTSITHNLLATDKSKLESVTFVSSTDVSTKTASLTLKTGSTVVGSPYSCSLGTYTAGSMTITCNTADLPLLSAFDTTGLTVN